MARDVLYVDVGGAVTTARAVSVAGDEVETHGFSFCPSPPATSDDLTAAVSPAVDSVMGKLARLGRAFDPQEIMVTVSAGGEPRTVCAGVVRGISGESARRAALSAGATVADLIAVDDGRQDFERVSDLRRQEISMVVLAGGVDEEILSTGRHQLFSIARVIAEGLPRKRGSKSRVPLVYAASQEGREEVTRIFGEGAEIIWADNVRATLEQENLDSARNAVAQAFSQGVRIDPRFSGLGRLGGPVAWPTGHAVGTGVEDLSRRLGENLLAISLDGDAVQIFSSIKGVFTRTVTQVERVDLKGVLRQLPAERLAEHAADMLGNWKLHPYILPRTWDELAVFLAFWKEAVKEAMRDHRETAIELRGVHRQRQISETFKVDVAGGDTLVRMERVPRIIVTGYLSRLLSPGSLVSIVMDGAGPSGITAVLADPGETLQLAGLLSRSGTAARTEASLRPLAFLVSPGRGEERLSAKRAFTLRGQILDPLPLKVGEVAMVPVEAGALDTELVLDAPAGVDLGEGEGRRVRARVKPGFPAIYLDGRGRPQVRQDRAFQDIRKCYRSMRVFPDEVMSGWAGGRE
jgi:hypothetical protein